MNSLDLQFTSSDSENKGPLTGSDTRSARPSVFGIIVVGLLAGLVAGLLAGPNFTLQGFFLGFAGGALVTAGVYFFTFERNPPSR